MRLLIGGGGATPPPLLKQQPMSLLLICSLLLLLLPPPTTPDWTTGCTERYPASCRCTWSSGKRRADCNKANMISLPVLSSDIQILDMSNNKLTQLYDNGFTEAKLINLQKLYLKGCKITKVHELAFNNLRILIELDLSFNEIEFIDPIVFSTNVRLKNIKLNNNKLLNIREFPPLEHLSHLDLSYNLLSNLSYGTFIGLRNLKVLDLSYNQLANINPDMFPKLSSLSLRGNAWVCDCELKPFRDYVVRNKFYDPELRCTEPLNVFNSPWDGFDELSCKPEILHILANGKVVDSIVALENTLVLSCVVKGDPLPDVKWVKNGRVVQEAQRTVDLIDGVVMLNLTVGRHDNEFVCVGSNSGGVVERNLTVTLDEAGLSGFVVLKDGIDGGLSGVGAGGGLIGGKDYRGGLIIYLVIGVVFLSLVIGLVVGGVCVWRWGQRGGIMMGENHDTVVKGVLKDTDRESSAHHLHPHHPDSGGGDGVNADEQREQFLVEQSPLLLKPHHSADDLLGDHHHHHHLPLLSPSSTIQRQRPTPDLLINNGSPQQQQDEEEEDDNESDHLYNKFPQQQDNSSIYDNHELVYRPLVTPINTTTPADRLRRYCVTRDGIYGHSSTLQRPSSVCSEPRGVIYSNNSPLGRNDVVSPVILPSSHGYVTLPRKSIHHNQHHHQRKKELVRLPIKYDNLGPRTTADGSSSISLNDCGVDAMHNNSKLFEPIIEQPLDETPLSSSSQQQQDLLLPEQQPIGTPIDTYSDGTLTPTKKKFRPIPPPKPKKKPVNNSITNNEDDGNVATIDKSEPAGNNVPEDNNADDDHDDDGTEV